MCYAVVVHNVDHLYAFYYLDNNLGASLHNDYFYV